VFVKGSFSCESVHGFEQGFAYYLATPTLSEFLDSQAQGQKWASCLASLRFKSLE